MSLLHVMLILPYYTVGSRSMQDQLADAVSCAPTTANLAPHFDNVVEEELELNVDISSLSDARPQQPFYLHEEGT